MAMEFSFDLRTRCNFSNTVLEISILYSLYESVFISLRKCVHCIFRGSVHYFLYEHGFDQSTPGCLEQLNGASTKRKSVYAISWDGFPLWRCMSGYVVLKGPLIVAYDSHEPARELIFHKAVVFAYVEHGSHSVCCRRNGQPSRLMGNSHLHLLPPIAYNIELIFCNKICPFPAMWNH